jgi:hypothetical protein
MGILVTTKTPDVFVKTKTPDGVGVLVTTKTPDGHSRNNKNTRWVYILVTTKTPDGYFRNNKNTHKPVRLDKAKLRYRVFIPPTSFHKMDTSGVLGGQFYSG